LQQNFIGQTEISPFVGTGHQMPLFLACLPTRVNAMEIQIEEENIWRCVNLKMETGSSKLNLGRIGWVAS
jgi:hypothetical protein